MDLAHALKRSVTETRELLQALADEERLRTEPDAPLQLVADLAALYHETDSIERGRSFFRPFRGSTPKP